MRLQLFQMTNGDELIEGEINRRILYVARIGISAIRRDHRRKEGPQGGGITEGRCIGIIELIP